jgi:E3 ubiquitin-protein ligase CHFR
MYIYTVPLKFSVDRGILRTSDLQKFSLQIFCVCAFRFLLCLLAVGALCNQPFCHMYWGCSQPGCNGCLSLFKDMEVSEASLSSSINENPFEWNVLKDYLRGQSKTVKDMLRECISRLDSGQHHCSDLRITSDVVTCRRCALTPMKQLVYLYRSDIPTSDLPESARRRPDCHWGKNCRTQKHNASHAARYNHVCEQTRTS